MLQFVHEAGWGFWPVAIFGAIALVMAVRHALGPRERQLPLVIGFSVATAIAGCLGTIRGIQSTAAYVVESSAGSSELFLIGLRESLNCAVAAFVMITVATLIATVGSYRLCRNRESSTQRSSALA